jgi:hypothetical protein
MKHGSKKPKIKAVIKPRTDEETVAILKTISTSSGKILR